MTSDDFSVRDALGKRFTRRDVMKGAAAVAAGAVVAPALAACGGDDTATSPSPGASAGGPKTGGVLRVGVVGGSAKDTLDPHISITEPDTAIEFTMYDGLQGFTPDYQLENRLAEEVSANADASVWTVRLKEGVVFHDGKPLTADDVVYTYKRILDPTNPGHGASSLIGLTPSGITKIDERTVEFRLEKPNAVLTDGFAVRMNMILPVDFDPKNPVGTGPFKLKKFAPGQEIDFLPNADYWGEGPYVDELKIIEFADPAARVNALLGGTVDMISQVPRAQMSVIEGTTDLKILRSETGYWIPFTMRMDQKPFEDVRVRQAFRLIADRDQLVEQAIGGLGRAANDMWSPFDPAYPSDFPQRTQDLEQAKSLLKQAGYADLTVELVTSEAISGSAVAAAQVLAEQAKGAGVTVDVKKVDPGTFYGDNYLQWNFAQDYWYTRNYLIQASQGAVPDAPYNEPHWRDAEWQAIVEQAWQTADDTKRNELIREAYTIDYERGANIIWAFSDQIDGYSSKLGGVEPDKGGIPLRTFRFNFVYFT